MNLPAEDRAEEVYEVQGTNIVVTPALRSHIGILLLLLIVTPIVGYWSANYPEVSIQHIEFGESFSVPIPILAVIPLILLGMLLHATYNTRLVVCPEYLLFVSGIISWREKSIRLDYNRIQEIEIDESIPQKILAIGDIIITPIATGIESQIKIPGVSRPRIVKDLIREKSGKRTPGA